VHRVARNRFCLHKVFNKGSQKKKNREDKGRKPEQKLVIPPVPHCLNRFPRR
jgi:hypothetical protein